MRQIKNFNLFEGRAFKDTKKPYQKKAWDADKKEDFRNKIKELIKSHKLSISQVGNDFEVKNDGDLFLQVMFRDDYVGVKEKGKKFVDEFKYTELGKIKSKINNIVKTCCESNEAKSYKKSKDLDDYQYDFIESAINLGNEADSYHRHITDMESLESVLEEINYFRDLINKVSSKLQAYEAKAKDTLK